MNIDITQVTAELFDTRAEEFAKKFKKPEATQLRRFYDELVRFEQLAQQKPEQWDNILPLVKMMNAKVSYALGRQHVDKEFHETFVSMIRQIKELSHLQHCKHFIEATIGFRKRDEKINKHR